MSAETEVAVHRVILKQHGKTINDDLRECKPDGYGEWELTKKAYREVDLLMSKMISEGKASKGYYDCEIRDESTFEFLGGEILVA